MYHGFIHLLYQRVSCCFQVLAIMNKAAVNIHADFAEHKFLIHLNKYQGGSMIAGLYDESVFSSDFHFIFIGFFSFLFLFCQESGRF